MNPILRVLAPVLAALALVLASSGTATAAEPVQITDGTLRWGVKASWRQYAGSGVMSGGVSQAADGFYEFPIESGSYDPETRTTTVRATGTIHWRGHYYPNESQFISPPPGYTGPLDIYILDITFTDPEVTISEAGSELTVEAVSRSVATWELVDVGRKPVVELDPTAITPVVSGGTTTWTGIPTALTEAGSAEVFGGNYPVGQTVDPVSLTYTGDGGAPDFSERWDAPDSNGLSLAVNGVLGEYVSGSTLLADPVRGIVHSVRQSLTGGYVLQAVDLRAGALVGTPLEFDASGFVQLAGAPIADPETGTLYYSSAGNSTIDSTFRWNPETGAYERGTVAPFTVAGPQRQLWDAAHDRSILVTRIIPAGAGTTDWAAHEWYAITYTRQPGGGFSERRYRLPNGPAGYNRLWYSSTMGSAAIAPDGSVLLPRRTLGVAQPGITPAVIETLGVHRIVLDDVTGTASASEIPGTESTLADVSQLRHYELAFANEHGDVAFIKAGLQNVIQSRIAQFTLARDGSLTPAGPPVLLDQVRNAAFAQDPVDGTVWHLDDRGGRLTGVRDARVAYSKTFAILNTRSPAIGTLADQSVWVQSTDGNPTPLDRSVYGYARFAFDGYSPVVAEQPADTAVVAGQTATLTAAATGTPAPSIRWQRRAPGSSRFVDVPGATARTLTVATSAGDNGAAYRAVFANAAGTLASDVAELEVRFAPSVTFEIGDQSAVEGDDATFELLATGSPEPVIEWQRRVGGFWQAVDGDDFAVDGNRLTVRDVDPAMDGALFRAKVGNSVGVAYTRVASLNVVPALTGPVTFGSGYMDWGIAERWRCYVVGNVAHGAIAVSGGATQVPGTLASGPLCTGANAGSEVIRFPVRGGTYDPATGALTVRLAGTVRFTGHGGALDTTFTNLRIADGTLVADTIGATMQSPTPVTRTNVPLVSLSLPDASLSDSGIAWDGALSVLTTAGSEVFGSYPADEPFDPLTLALVYGTPQADPQPQPAPPPAGGPPPADPQPRPSDDRHRRQDPHARHEPRRRSGHDRLPGRRPLHGHGPGPRHRQDRRKALLAPAARPVEHLGDAHGDRPPAVVQGRGPAPEGPPGHGQGQGRRHRQRRPHQADDRGRGAASVALQPAPEERSVPRLCPQHEHGTDDQPADADDDRDLDAEHR